MAFAWSQLLQGQFLQFSQFSMMPALVNPAATGSIPNDNDRNNRLIRPTNSLKLTAAYRSQFYAQNYDYTGQFLMLEGKVCLSCSDCSNRWDNQFWAWGLSLQQDGSRFASFQHRRATGYGAYSRQLNRYLSLAAGGSIGLFNYGFDPNGLRFGQQFDGMDYNPLLPTGEAWLANNWDTKGGRWQDFQLDANAGLQLYGPKWLVGAAIYHLNGMDYRFLSDSVSNNELNRGFVAHTSFPVPLLPERNLLVKALWRFQSIPLFRGNRQAYSRQHQLMLGLHCPLMKPGDTREFLAGVMVRMGNHNQQTINVSGLIVNLQGRQGQWLWGLSYDFPLGKTMSISPGAVELTTARVFGKKQDCIYCPHF